MADFEEVPERIRSLLDSLVDTEGELDSPLPAEWEDLAMAYAELCHDAASRLRRCDEYLRKGMRSEAVHLSACQPELPDLIAALTIPGWPRWVRFCARHGLAMPPRLPVSGGERLEQAASRENELGPLLSRHRALAVARAPVRDRLETLRLIAEADPDNPCWSEDLGLLDKARLLEIRREAQAAWQKRDLPHLSALWSELETSPWRTDIPPKLRDTMHRAVQMAGLEVARKDLRAMMAELADAQQTGEVDRAAALLDQWRMRITSLGLTLPADLEEKIRPVAAWVSLEMRRRELEQRRHTARPALDAQAQQSDSSRAGHFTSWLIVTTVIAAAGVAAALVYLYSLFTHVHRH